MRGFLTIGNWWNKAGQFIYLVLVVWSSNGCFVLRIRRACVVHHTSRFAFNSAGNSDDDRSLYSDHVATRCLNIARLRILLIWCRRCSLTAAISSKLTLLSQVPDFQRLVNMSSDRQISLWDFDDDATFVVQWHFGDVMHKQNYVLWHLLL